MVEAGGEPLPVVAYIFLGIQYSFRVLFSLLLAVYLTTSFEGLWKWTVLIVCYGVVVFFARVCEVLIRTVLVRYLTKKYSKQYAEEIKEKETM